MVTGVDICDDEICIKFKNEKNIYIYNNEEIDYSWVIEEINFTNQLTNWSIICENNNLFFSSN